MIKNQTFYAFARTGEASISGKDINFPVLLEAGTDLKSEFDSYQILNEACESRKIQVNGKIIKIWESENFFVVNEIPDFILRSRLAVKHIMEIKRELGYGKLLYVPGISDPYLIPSLLLMGIDVFDDINARIESTKGIKYTMFGRVSDSRMEIMDNTSFIKNELSLLSRSILDGSLFNVVEHFTISPKNSEIIRHLEGQHYESFEKNFPRYTPKVLAGGIDSLYRPDVKRFNEFISDHYQKPNDAQIALFIPCSARKPYSRSQSHRRLNEAIRPFRNEIQEVILTSPVALVPRDLEDAYPPRFYDIPVTGRWYEEERKHIREVLFNFLRNNHFKNIIFFLPEDMKFVKEFEVEGSTFITWKKGENTEFQELMDLLNEKIEQTKSRRDFIKEKMISIASYQFGNWIRQHLQEMRVTRMFNQFMLTLNGKPYFIFNEDAGKLTIHRDAASIFLEEGKFLVEIDDFKPTSNIYAMGIRECSPEVRSGDEVVVHHNGEVRGVGIARMSSEQMIKNERGTAVRMRN